MSTEKREFDLTPRPRQRRPKLVLQRDTEDCGAAALATVCAYFGHRPGLRYLSRLSRVSVDGTSLAALSEAAAVLGLDTQGVRTELDELANLPLPAIAPLGYHFVVVHAVSRGQVIVGDPAVGWRTLSAEEFDAEWDGNLLLFQETPEFGELSLPRRDYLGHLRSLTHGLRGPILSIIGLTLGLNAAILALPVLTQKIVDHLLGERTIGALDAHSLIAVAAVVLVFASLIEGTRYFAVHRVSTRIQLQFGRLFTERLLRLPLSYFLNHQTSDSLNRMDEIQRLSDFFGAQGAEAIVDSLLAVLALAIIFYYSPQIGFLLLISGGALLAASFFVGSRVYSLLVRSLQTQMSALTTFLESVRRAALLKGYGAEKAWVDRWYGKSETAVTLQRRARDWNSALSAAAQFVMRAMPLVVIWIGFAAGRNLTVGTVLGLMTLLTVALTSLLKLSGHYLEAQKVFLGIERLLDVLEEPEESSLAGRMGDDVAEPPRAVESKAGSSNGSSNASSNGSSNASGNGRQSAPELEARDLSYSYRPDGEDAVLRGVDFTVERGQTIAIVGTSGSGKTTLAYLLSRLLFPLDGHIHLGGRDVRDLELAEVRGSVILVPQEAPLVTGSILDNIVLGEEDPDCMRALEALQLAQAESFVLAHPRGLYRELSEDGIGLSAGQRQRLAIARALYRRPRVLILDEPTSALDSESESALMAALKSLQGRQTMIVIAHRLQTIAHADLVVVLDDGRIVEEGTPDELLEREGRYAAMVQAAKEQPSRLALSHAL